MYVWVSKRGSKCGYVGGEPEERRGEERKGESAGAICMHLCIGVDHGLQELDERS